MTTCYLLRTYASYPLEVDLVPRLFSDEMIIGPAQSLSPVLQAQKKTIRSNMIGFSAIFRHSNSRRDLRDHPACRLSSTRVVGTNNIFATNTTWQRKHRTYTYSDPGMSSVLPNLDRIYSITMSISLSSSQLPRIQTKDPIDLPQNCRFISFPFCYSSRIITTPRTCRIISIGLCSKHIGQ